jgi:hypothetical protein
MSLDLGKLENVRQRGKGFVARCPACAADGHDTAGDHLFINPGGAFGCVIHPGPDGRAHRSTIMRLAGDRAVRTLKCETPAVQAPPTVIAKDILRTHRTPILNPCAQETQKSSAHVKDSGKPVRSVRPDTPPPSEQRWGVAPADIPLATALNPIAPSDAALLTSYLQRQGDDVVSWTSTQAQRYRATYPLWPRHQCQLAAALDCALWQHESRSEAMDRPALLSDLLSMLRFLEKAASFRSGTVTSGMDEDTGSTAQG